jgi:hypothetical protein
MSLREELQKYCGETAEQKLLIVRRELVRPVVTVQTAAHLFQQVGPELSKHLPDAQEREEFLNTVKWLAEAARDLEEIVNAMECDELPPHHRHN